MARMERQRVLIDRLQGEWPAWLVDAGVRYRRGMGAVVWESLADAERGWPAPSRGGTARRGWWREKCPSIRSGDDRQRFQAQLGDVALAFAVVTHLMLWSGLSSEVLCLMARSPSSMNLYAIRLHEWTLSGNEVAALADTSNLSGVRRLDLAQCQFVAGAQDGYFGVTRQLQQLEELNLDGAPVKKGGARQGVLEPVGPAAAPDPFAEQ